MKINAVELETASLFFRNQIQANDGQGTATVKTTVVGTVTKTITIHPTVTNTVSSHVPTTSIFLAIFS